MKTPERWLEQISILGNQPDVLTMTREFFIGLIRQIQHDASLPDVPPGMLLEDHHIEAMLRDLAKEVPGTMSVSGTGYDDFINHSTLGTIARSGSISQASTGGRVRDVIRVFHNLYLAHQNLPEVLVAYQRVVALLRDLSLDNATERYNAGYEAGRKAALADMKSRITEQFPRHGATSATVNWLLELLDMEEPTHA